MARSLLQWMRAAPAEELCRARSLLTWAATRAGAQSSAPVRAAAGAFAAEAMRPAVLRAAWADPAEEVAAAAAAAARVDNVEVKVLQVR